MAEKLDNKFVGLLTLFFLTFGIFFSVVVFNKPLNQFIKASQQLSPSAENSLILVYPLTAKADGVEQVIVNVFLRTKDGTPISNYDLFVNTTLGSFDKQTQKTGKDGKATFILTSNSPGISEITARTPNISLNKKVSVKFE